MPHRVASTWIATILCAVALLSSPLSAHEVQPAVADMTIDGDTVIFDMEATIEPFIAGVDLEGLGDTNGSELSDQMDALRALGPDDLEAAFRDYFPDFANSMEVRTGETTVPLQLGSMSIPEPGDTALPRVSQFVVTGALPADTEAITVGWDARLGALVLRQMEAGPDAFTGYLQNGGVTDPISRAGTVAQSPIAAFVDFVSVGFAHIIPLGLDHILFVLGLFFLSTRIGPLLWQVSAFTAAHTVTLALAALGVVSAPASIVEPLIAASIVYVGVENVLSHGMTPWRPVVVLLFGLLHGLGFAGVLSEYGLGSSNFVPKLIGFNVGVELGQLAVIAIAFLAVGLWFGRKSWYRDVIANPASIAIALVGAYWFVERVWS